jgi:hypothetical protein
MLVLDANILFRPVFGVRVLDILREYSKVVHFAVTDVAAGEAREHLPAICRKRRTVEFKNPARHRNRAL